MFFHVVVELDKDVVRPIHHIFGDEITIELPQFARQEKREVCVEKCLRSER